jgi:hypothetical protein
VAPLACVPRGVAEAGEDEDEAEADARTDAEASTGAVTAEAAAVAEAGEAGRLAGAAGGKEPPGVQPREAGTAWCLWGQPVYGG